MVLFFGSFSWVGVDRFGDRVVGFFFVLSINK